MVETQLLAGKQGVDEAAALLRAGAVVGIPTETVYGLAADARNPQAVEKIFLAKGRPQDNPLIVHINDLKMLPLIVAEFPAKARQLAQAFWPGPLTMILPVAEGIAPQVTTGLGTVGVRMPAHPLARQIIQAAGMPLAAPSANRSGSPSPTTAQHVLQDMKGRIPLVVDGEDCLVGLESTVVSLVVAKGEPTLLLRPGFVTAEELEAVLQEPVKIAGTVEAPLPEGQRPESPGMKYRHYAPAATLTVLDGTLACFVAYVTQAAKKEPGLYVLCFEEEAQMMPVPAVTFGRGGDAASQANALFAALRRLDELHVKVAYVRLPNADGVGMAVRNRLLRAAGFRVIKL